LQRKSCTEVLGNKYCQFTTVNENEHTELNKQQNVTACAAV